MYVCMQVILHNNAISFYGSVYVCVIGSTYYPLFKINDFIVGQGFTDTDSLRWEKTPKFKCSCDIDRVVFPFSNPPLYYHWNTFLPYVYVYVLVASIAAASN